MFYNKTMLVRDVNLVLAIPRGSSLIGYSVYGTVVSSETDLSDLGKVLCWLTVDCLGSRAVRVSKFVKPKAGDKFRTSLSNWSSAEVSSSALIWLDRLGTKDTTTYFKDKWLNGVYKVGQLTSKGYGMSVPVFNQGLLNPPKDIVIVSEAHTGRGRTVKPRFPYSGGSSFFTLRRFRKSVFAWRRVSVPILLRFLKEFRFYFGNGSMPVLFGKKNINTIAPFSRQAVVLNNIIFTVFFLLTKLAHRKTKRIFFSQLRVLGVRRVYRQFVDVQKFLKLTTLRSLSLLEFVYKKSLYCSIVGLVDFFILYAFLNADFSKAGLISPFLQFVRYRPTQRRPGNNKPFETLKPVLNNSRGRRRWQLFSNGRYTNRRKWRASLTTYSSIVKKTFIHLKKRIVVDRRIGFLASSSTQNHLPWRSKGWKRYTLRHSRPIRLHNARLLRSILLERSA